MGEISAESVNGSESVSVGVCFERSTELKVSIKLELHITKKKHAKQTAGHANSVKQREKKRKEKRATSA